MSVDNVKSFNKRLEKDEEFRTGVLKDETLKDLDMGKLITVATKHGYEFTETHFEKAKEDYGDSELSKAQLEKAAGGRGKPVCHTVGFMPTHPTISLSEGYEARKPGAAIGFCFGLGLH